MRLIKSELGESGARGGIERACVAAFKKFRWGEGFKCPKCGHGAAWFFQGRKVYQCSCCRFQVSMTMAGVIGQVLYLPVLGDYLVGRWRCFNRWVQVNYERQIKFLGRRVFMDKRFVFLLAAVVAYGMALAL